MAPIFSSCSDCGLLGLCNIFILFFFGQVNCLAYTLPKPRTTPLLSCHLISSIKSISCPVCSACWWEQFSYLGEGPLLDHIVQGKAASGLCCSAQGEAFHVFCFVLFWDCSYMRRSGPSPAAIVTQPLRTQRFTLRDKIETFRGSHRPSPPHAFLMNFLSFVFLYILGMSWVPF